MTSSITEILIAAIIVVILGWQLWRILFKGADLKWMNRTRLGILLNMGISKNSDDSNNATFKFIFIFSFIAAVFYLGAQVMIYVAGK